MARSQGKRVKITVRDGLPFAVATVEHRGQEAVLENVLLDTGSAGTILSADRLAEIGVRYQPEDSIHRIRGVGGTELVFSKRLDYLAMGDLGLVGFEVEIGALDYGFDFDGIVGVDFLMAVGAVIDLGNLVLHGSRA